MVTYTAFITKYPVFSEVPEIQFNLFLQDAVADMSRYNWQVLGNNWEIIKDRAIETLIACQLTQTNQEFLPVQEFEVRESAYKVKYASSNNTVGGSWYCVEHQRLLSLVKDLTKPITTLPTQTQSVRKIVWW